MCSLLTNDAGAGHALVSVPAGGMHPAAAPAPAYAPDNRLLGALGGEPGGCSSRWLGGGGLLPGSQLLWSGAGGGEAAAGAPAGAMGTPGEDKEGGKGCPYRSGTPGWHLLLRTPVATATHHMATRRAAVHLKFWL